MVTEKIISSLESWLAEDLGSGDITSNIIESNQDSEFVVTGDSGILSGSIPASRLMSEAGLNCIFLKSDGNTISSNEKIASILGDFNLILSRERLFLNILSHLSGISTLTREIVDIVNAKNPNTTVLATRKTTPGMRILEKEAVIHGGGAPHRYDLSEALLIKDNHMHFITDLKTYIEKARLNYPNRKIEIEADDMNQALSFADFKVDRIMLDNFTPEEAKKTYSALKEKNKFIEVEVSGGLNKENIAEYANYADFLSLGCLTIGAPSINFTMHVNSN